jgi:peptidoglycan L-alanyl-D-glutamate endopeptidase CwlK
LDTISLTRLQTVHPELRRRILQLDQLLTASSLAIHLRVTQALRTWPEQAALYAQGRTVPGPIVTNAKPGTSMHNYGLAVDCCPDLPGLTALTWKPDWSSADARWKSFLAQALTCGLAEGATWRSFPDAPHLYLQELPADPDDNLKALLTDGGIQGVWDWVDLTYGFSN